MLDPVLLRIAKTAVMEEFDSQYRIEKAQLLQKYPFLAKKAATFVTLNKEKELRGCIGSVIAYRSLLDDLVSNAKSAAFSDPRFQPLDNTELESLEVEVSVLSQPQPIEYKDIGDLVAQIVPKKDGLILRYAQFQGTFLPQVWEQIPNVEMFLEHLSYKAGGDPTIYRYHPEILRYRVEHISEAWNAILPI